MDNLKECIKKNDIISCKVSKKEYVYIASYSAAEKYKSKDKDTYDSLTYLFANYLYINHQYEVSNSIAIPVVAELNEMDAYIVYFKIIKKRLINKGEQWLDQYLTENFNKALSKVSKNSSYKVLEFEIKNLYNKYLLLNKKLNKEFIFSV